MGRDIRGDLVVAGGDISIEKNAVVSGNILASGGNMTLYGNVDGNIKADATYLFEADPLIYARSFHPPSR